MDPHDEKVGVLGIEDLPTRMKRNLIRFFKSKEKENERISRSRRISKFNRDLVGLLSPMYKEGPMSSDLNEGLVYQIIKAQERGKARRLNHNPEFVYQFTKEDEGRENERINNQLGLLRQMARVDQEVVDPRTVKRDHDRLSQSFMENKAMSIDRRISVLSKLDKESKKSSFLSLILYLIHI